MAAYTEEGRKSDLQLIIGASKSLILIKVDFAEAISAEFGDIVEADFTGYSRIPINWGPITINGDLNAECTSQQASFSVTGTAVGNNIYGWAMIDHELAPPALVHLHRYDDAPRPMNAVGNTILLTVTKTQGGCP